MTSSLIEPPSPLPGARAALRASLLAARSVFARSPEADAAHAALARHLLDVIDTLQPDCLGVYWPVRSEFNAIEVVRAPRDRPVPPLALPFVHKSPPRMEYRAWDGAPPTLRDEAAIPCATGAATVPDVVLVPCLGFTDAGYRLGYGGGYFDRWLAAHSHVTAVGVGWEISRIDSALFTAQPHDVALTLVVTERGAM